MAFRFKLSEPFEEGCRRVAREQFERAQSQLRSTADATVAVHETRKCLKRLRALLRLIRPAIGDHAFRFENAHLREIGALLSGARDRHVLIETITKLEAATGHDGLGDSVRALLTEQNGDQGDDVDAAAMKRALKELDEVKKRLSQLPISGRGFGVVGAGLEMSYRRACRAFDSAYEMPNDEAVHEWRKGVQQHWRHMLLLSRAWPDCIDARAAEARQLSQILGDDHDLAILVAFVHSERASSIPAENIALIEQAARTRQTELRAMAHPMGKRLFEEGPKALRRRISSYWKAAVASKKLTDVVQEAAEVPSPAPADAKEAYAHKSASSKKSALTERVSNQSAKPVRRQQPQKLRKPAKSRV